MKGLVKVTPESLLDLCSKCAEYMQSFNKEDYSTKELRWSWRKFKKIEWTVYSGLPFWHQYRHGLFPHLKELSDMAKRAQEKGDEIWLSELSYCHLVKLSNGDKHTNPIFIMNY